VNRSRMIFRTCAVDIVRERETGQSLTFARLACLIDGAVEAVNSPCVVILPCRCPSPRLKEPPEKKPRGPSHDFLDQTLKFDPPQIAIAAGDSVFWTNKTTADYNVCRQRRTVFKSRPPR